MKDMTIKYTTILTSQDNWKLKQIKYKEFIFN